MLVSYCYFLCTIEPFFKPLIPWGIEDRPLYQGSKERVLLPVSLLPSQGHLGKSLNLARAPVSPSIKQGTSCPYPSQPLRNMGRVKHDNNGWEIVSSLQMNMPLTLLLFHVQHILLVSLSAFRVQYCSRENQVANENFR